MKYKTELCDDSLSFDDCELTILKKASDLAKDKIGRKIASDPEIQKMIEIVEEFLRIKKLICYGGTAINNILPKQSQFYNKEVEIPDYDFFSNNSLNDAKELADMYFKKGYTIVQASSGLHHGTYKVFVNYIPIADITHIPKPLYEAIKKEAIKVAGILYTPPNYLRMSMYLELSRPAGDTSRYEKVYKRLKLLNEHYPMNVSCDKINIKQKREKDKNANKIYENVKNTFIDDSVVFFGGYAVSQYSKYMPKNIKNKVSKIPNFDVLSNNPSKTATLVEENLNSINVKNVRIQKHESLGEVVPDSYEVIVGKETIAFIYKTLGCHSYNNITIDNKNVRIATIETMLSFYLAFLYDKRHFYDPDRIACMSKFLYDVQQKNRLEQNGILKRFSVTCYGHQDRLSEAYAMKSKMYDELKNKKNSREYEEWFLQYSPSNNINKYNKTKKKKSLNNKSRKNNK